MKSKLAFLLVLCASVGLCSPSFAESATTDAQSFFQKYVALGNSYDASLAQLYADDAKIVNTRYYPNGQTKTMTIPMPAYKQMIVSSMPLAKAHGDQDTYSKISYANESGATKITALRHNKVKNYDSWLVLVIRKTPAGWKITQEMSQSRPRS